MPSTVTFVLDCVKTTDNDTFPRHIKHRQEMAPVDDQKGDKNRTTQHSREHRKAEGAGTSHGTNRVMTSSQGTREGQGKS